MLDTVIARVIIFLLGSAVVVATLISAIRTFVVPRSLRDKLSRLVFQVVRLLFKPWTNSKRSYAQRDRVMALYAPFALLLLPVVWITFVMLGYTAIYWGAGVRPLRTAFTLSGSSLLTLGFASVDRLPVIILNFSEAAIGLILVALLISYLPTMYAAFSRRETNVTMLEVRAGSPPSAIEMLKRYQRIHSLDRLGDVWASWEVWFTDIEESHTSLGALTFFRSPQPERSWVTAAGAILDAAALTNSVVDVPHDARADLCIRAGYIALRRIADFFRISYNPQPKPGDPISITRAEFDTACEDMARQGVALKDDREKAWRDFQGWRVNYDTVLVALAILVMAPDAPWSSDRVRLATVQHEAPRSRS